MELFQKVNGSSDKSENEDSLEQQEQWTQQLHLTNVEHEARAGTLRKSTQARQNH